MKIEEIKKELNRAFGKYEFVEDGHYYLCNGKRVGIGVTTFIGQYENEFDSETVAGFVAKKENKDIDEVLADWVGHWTKYHKQDTPEHWNFDRDIASKFESLKDDKEFWLSIPVKTSPSDIPFEPHCYITSRSIPKEWTEEWLDKNGFPTLPVYSIGHGISKVEAVKNSGVDIYVDDRFENFVELNNTGVCCFLFDTPHNRRYEVGYKRIKSLSELV